MASDRKRRTPTTTATATATELETGSEIVPVPPSAPASPRANATTWKPGQTGNPNGRKPVGKTLAEAIRARMPPDRLSELVIDIAENGEKDQDKLKALIFLAERGYPAPPVKIEHSGAVGVGVMNLTSAATRDRLRELLERAAAGTPGGDPVPVIDVPIADDDPDPEPDDSGA